MCISYSECWVNVVSMVRAVDGIMHGFSLFREDWASLNEVFRVTNTSVAHAGWSWVFIRIHLVEIFFEIVVLEY